MYVLYLLQHFQHQHFLSLWVCVCVCVCVCVVCLFIFLDWKDFSWLNKTINVKPELRSVMIYCQKISVSRTFVFSSKTIIEGAFRLATAKESQLNWMMPWKVKDNCYKLATVSWKFGQCSARASLKIWWIFTHED